MSATPKLYLLVISLLVGFSTILLSNHPGLLPEEKGSSGGGIRDTLNPEIVIQPDSFYVVMEIGGDKVYWPSQNIYTLTHLDPGKAYYIRVTGDCSIHFPSPVK
jgi:hypothetical protein